MDMVIITLVIGDWSGDGHEKTQEQNISCNLTREELEAAFKKGEEIIGIHFQDHFSDYEKYELPISMIKKMSKFFDIGFDNIAISEEEDEDLDEEEDDEDVEYIATAEYLELWLKIAKVGNPQLVYEICKSHPYVYIGGYGLFS